MRVSVLREKQMLRPCRGRVLEMFGEQEGVGWRQVRAGVRLMEAPAEPAGQCEDFDVCAQ